MWRRVTPVRLQRLRGRNGACGDHDCDADSDCGPGFVSPHLALTDTQCGTEPPLRCVHSRGVRIPIYRVLQSHCAQVELAAGSDSGSYSKAPRGHKSFCRAAQGGQLLMPPPPADELSGASQRCVIWCSRSASDPEAESGGVRFLPGVCRPPRWCAAQPGGQARLRIRSEFLASCFRRVVGLLWTRVFSGDRRLECQLGSPQDRVVRTAPGDGARTEQSGRGSGIAGASGHGASGTQRGGVPPTAAFSGVQPPGCESVSRDRVPR